MHRSVSRPVGPCSNAQSYPPAASIRLMSDIPSDGEIDRVDEPLQISVCYRERIGVHIVTQDRHCSIRTNTLLVNCMVVQLHAVIINPIGTAVLQFHGKVTEPPLPD